MKYLAAYLLLVVGGNATPSADDVTALITTAGGEVDAEKLSVLLADVEGKDINELLAKGEESIKSISTGGGGGGGAAAPAAAAAAPAAAAAKPKVEEVDALDGGMDMFGGEKGGGDY